MKSASGDGV